MVVTCSSTMSTTVRTISRVAPRLTERTSSRGAVPKTSGGTCSSASGSRNQATNAPMPAWATRPTHERSSALMARYQGSRSSIRATAAVDRLPTPCSTRRRVASLGPRWPPVGAAGSGGTGGSPATRALGTTAA